MNREIVNVNKYIDQLRIQYIKFSKWLIKKDISNDAKLLYCLISDRYQLSTENNWKDKYGKTYCYYSRKQMMNDLRVSKGKVTRLVKELVKNNLLNEVRQGFNKPNRLYPLNPSEEELMSYIDFDMIEIEKATKQVENTERYQNNTSESSVLNTLEVSKIDTNNTYINNTKFSNNSIYQSERSKNNVSNIKDREDKIDRELDRLTYFEHDSSNEFQWRKTKKQMLSYEAKNLNTEQYYKYIKNRLKWQLDYSYTSEKYSKFKDIFNLILETYLLKKNEILKIAGNRIKAYYVQKRFDKLNSLHIDYVLESLDNINKLIRSPNNYILTTLYNSVSTMQIHYSNRVQVDKYNSL